MSTRLTAIIFLYAIAAFETVAGEDNVAKYRNFTPQQIAALPADVRKNSVPMMYLFASQKGLYEGSALLFGMELNSLMYAGVHDYSAAVKAFQRDLGDEPTGVLTVWQISKLEDRAEMQKLSDIGFPAQFFSYKDENSAGVDGTFVILDDKIAYPINHTKVRCDRSEKQCRVDQIYLSIPKKDAGGQRYHVFEFDPEYYTVTQWTQESVDAVPSTSARCRTTTMNLNFKTKEFYQITRNLGSDCEVLGTKLPKLEKPRISQIVDGETVFGEEFGRIREAAFDVLASDFRKKAEPLNPKQPKQ